jgi:hypothetical protein
MPDRDPTEDRPDGRYVSHGRIRCIERDSARSLVVHLSGAAEPVREAKVARCFPWSVPGRYIAVRDKDGKEIALLETLDELDPASRRVVEEELQESIFNPKIHRLLDFKREFGITSITADTDRGEVTFQIRSRDDVRVLSSRRALFRDADGITYELADLGALDPVSQRRLRQYF